MKTSIQFLAIVCVATITSMSFAQTQSTPIRLVDARGCEIYVPSSATVKEMTIANAVGECRSGKFEGGVLVGIGWDLAVPGQEVKSFIGMRAGVVSQGRFTGLRLSLNQEATLFLNGPSNEPELTRRFKQSEPGYSIEQVVSAIEELLPKAGGNTSDGARSFLVNLVRTWDRSPFDMMRSYTANWGQTTQNMAWVGLPPEQRQAYAASQANTSNQSSQSNSGITASKVETAAEVLNGVNNLLRASRGQAPLSLGSTTTVASGAAVTNSTGEVCMDEMRRNIAASDDYSRSLGSRAYTEEQKQERYQNVRNWKRSVDAAAPTRKTADAQRNLDAAMNGLNENKKELAKEQSSRYAHQSHITKAAAAVASSEYLVCIARYALETAGNGVDKSYGATAR